MTDAGAVEPPPSRLTAAHAASASSAILAVRVAGLGLSFVAATVAVRTLGEQRYALWAIVAGILAFANVADFGAGALLVRVAARRAGPVEVRRALLATVILLSAVFLAMTIVAAVAVPALASAANLSTSDVGVLRTALPAAVAATGLLGIFNAMNTTRAAFGKGAEAALTIGVGSLVQVGVAVVLLTTDHGIPSLVIAIWANALTVGVLAVMALRRELDGHVLARATRADFKHLMRFGGLLQVSNTTDAAGAVINRILIGRYATLAALVPVDLGSRLGLLVRVGPGALISGSFATVVQRANDPGVDLPSIFGSLFRVMAVSSAVPAAILIATGSPVVALMAGTHLEAVPWIMLASLVTLVLANVATAGTTMMRAQGDAVVEAKYSLLALGANATLCAALALRYGLGGALLGSALAAALGLAWFLWRVCGRWGRPGRFWRAWGFVAASLVGSTWLGLLLDAGSTDATAARSLILAALGGIGSIALVTVTGWVCRPLARADVAQIEKVLPRATAIPLARWLTLVSE